ncbi:hypothetical protein P8C59_000353 [Phyllachora maydis]|uniref:Sas10 C-terminal domain-containing protein n=1 Tax=Phyllachora maydis TaxID=1825666 RepID=A0AAD9HXH5_9PEZI|nr:hypothetical protein P8C59_000353 [Phyllachora maydis]
MGKKRKAPRPTAPAGPKEVDPADARLAINTFEDIADSEEEYFLNQDRIDFDEQVKSKRQRREEEEDEFLEQSGDEVFANQGSDESEDEEDGHARPLDGKGAPSQRKNLDGEDSEGDDREDESGWWGSSKQDYYNADAIETEADALEEEVEAKRLQKKKLAKMAEEDFMFDEGDWIAPETQGTQGTDVVTEVLKDVEITDEMGPEERYKILQSRYPEFDLLADELRELQPLAEGYQKEAEGKPARSLAVVRHWILSAYISTLASYFAILTSPARDGNGSTKMMDPTELRDHDVMETLMRCRKAWLRVKALKPRKVESSDAGVLSAPEEPEVVPEMTAAAGLKRTKREKAADAEAKARRRMKAKKAKEIEESIADLGGLLSQPVKAVKTKPRTAEALPKPMEVDDNRSDFGEEEMDSKRAALKDGKKRSLRFYTSQIVQKAAKRAEAGRDAGGDNDLPYRERHKDRQARLQAEAEKRGQKGSKHGVALDENSSGDDDDSKANGGGEGDADEEYYNMVANRAAAKKAAKAARYDALAAAKKGDRLVEEATIGEDGKRKITYAIEKNKGLAPRRVKQIRNPRVKKRMRFEEKKKKLASMRPVYKGGEDRGGYKGELSGIKAGVVKSLKL